MRHPKTAALVTALVLVVLSGGLMGFRWLGDDHIRRDASPARPSSQDRDQQKQDAIEQKDPALLPECTANDFSDRPPAVAPKSMDPWEHDDQLGCRLAAPRPDQIVEGPPGVPRPDHLHDTLWWLGIYRHMPTNYSTGIGAKMYIVNPGVDHDTDIDLYASRVLTIGSNGKWLEGGWFEGAFYEDSGQHVYYQDSNQCASPSVCDWIIRDYECNRAQGNAFITMNSVAATSSWSAWCYDGNSWHAMITGVNLGGLTANEQEALGEVRRSVSGTTTLPARGARFTSVQVRASSGHWATVRTTTSQVSLYDDDDPYELDMRAQYHSFYVDD